MAGQKQDDQLEHTYSSSVRIREVTLKTCQRRWTIGRSGERRSGISVLAARHGDDDEVGLFDFGFFFFCVYFLFFFFCGVVCSTVCLCFFRRLDVFDGYFVWGGRERIFLCFVSFLFSVFCLYVCFFRFFLNCFWGWGWVFCFVFVYLAFFFCLLIFLVGGFFFCFLFFVSLTFSVPPWGLSTLVKEFMAGAHIMQSSANKLSTLISGKV